MQYRQSAMLARTSPGRIPWSVNLSAGPAGAALPVVRTTDDLEGWSEENLGNTLKCSASETDITELKKPRWAVNIYVITEHLIPKHIRDIWWEISVRIRRKYRPEQ